jgi:hypothetical protein
LAVQAARLGHTRIGYFSMTMRGKNQRQIRKRILRDIEDTYDLKRLEYKKRVTPLKHAAKLFGVITAAIVYGLGFGLGFYALKTGKADYETFIKFSWIFMIPSSVIGVFAYMLNSNRREYGVARDILDYIDHVEGPRGMLWRYEPILLEFYPDDALVKRLIAISREGVFKGLEPEDYANLIHKLHASLSSGEERSISDEAAEAFEINRGDGVR